MQATASIPTELYSSPLTAPSVCEGPAFAGEVDRADEANAPDGSPVKGLLVALCVEAAAVLLCCGIWRAWHLIL